MRFQSQYTRPKSLIVYTKGVFSLSYDVVNAFFREEEEEMKSFFNTQPFSELHGML